MDGIAHVDLRMMRKDGEKAEKEDLEKILKELETQNVLTQRDGEVQQEEDGTLKFSGMYKFNDKEAKFTLIFAQDQEDF